MRNFSQKFFCSKTSENVRLVNYTLMLFTEQLVSRLKITGKPYPFPKCT